MKITERKQKYITNARAAFKAGRIEEGQVWKAKAEQAQAAIDGLKAVSGLNEALPLPKSGAGSVVTRSGASRKSVPDEAIGGPANIIYQMRFGDTESAIKGILRDLHGPNYEEVYWRQRKAFSTYLRRGEKPLSSEDHKLLKTIVLTPSSVKTALGDGIDDVSSLKASMVEAIDTLGGFGVPVDFQNRVIEGVEGYTVMRGAASVDKTSRDMVEIPVSTGGDDQYTSAVRVTWVDETPTAGTADTNLKFGLESIPIHTVMAETGLSRNMLEDHAFNIENFLAKKFAESLAIDEDNRFLTGSGIGTPQGILPGGTNILGLTESLSGSASALTWDGLLSLVYSVPTQYRQRAKWVANRSTFEAIAKLKNSGGDYLWNPYQFTGGAEGAALKLLGFPIAEQESMPDIASNSYPLIFGDLSGYQIFDRVGMTVERYLDSATARQNMIIYVMRRRLGGQPTETWRLAVQKVASS